MKNTYLVFVGAIFFASINCWASLEPFEQLKKSLDDLSIPNKSACILQEETRELELTCDGDQVLKWRWSLDNQMYMNDEGLFVPVRKVSSADIISLIAGNMIDRGFQVQRCHVRALECLFVKPN